MTPSKKSIKVIVAADHFELASPQGTIICIKFVEPDVSSQPSRIVASIIKPEERFHSDIHFYELAKALEAVIKRQIKADKKAKKK